jgi:transketolase
MKQRKKETPKSLKKRRMNVKKAQKAIRHSAKKTIHHTRQTGARTEFKLNEGMSLKQNIFSQPEEKSTREGFGEALVDLGGMSESIVVLTADLAESTKTDLFQKKFPNRFFNTGIAEANMLTISAGLSFCGKTPFASTFGVFATGRAWDQLRTSICYANANVKIAATHCGITVGEDGPTHQALSDIALTRTIPNLSVIVPCDYEQAKKAIHAAADIAGPVYIRLGRPKIPMITTEDTPFEFGKADIYALGADATIIATGEMVYEALIAAKTLWAHGLNVGVMNMHTIKPLDESAIVSAADSRLIVTAEDHHIIGGLGSAVAEVLSRMPDGEKPHQAMIGIGDEFGRSGEAKELMKIFHITSDDIVQAVLSSLKKS